MHIWKSTLNKGGVFLSWLWRQGRVLFKVVALQWREQKVFLAPPRRWRFFWIARKKQMLSFLYHASKSPLIIWCVNYSAGFKRCLGFIQSAMQGKAEKTIDEQRRTFLKYALFGGVVFLAGKYMNPLINLLQGDAVLSEKTFQNFKITETGKQLQVTDDDGNDVLIIDKDGY